MKTKNIFAIFCAVLLLVSSITGVLAADIKVVSKAPKAMEGQLYTHTFQLQSTFTKSEFIALTSTNAKGTFSLDKKTGTMKWVPPAGSVNSDFEVEVKGTTGSSSKTIKHKFSVEVLPALDVEVKLGKLGNLKTYKPGNMTDAFSPGDKIYFEVALKNQYTTQNHEFIKNTHPALGAITVVTNTPLPSFPADMVAAAKLSSLDLQPQQTRVLKFNYTIPGSSVPGPQPFDISFSGKDLQGNVYTNFFPLTFEVAKTNHDVLVKNIVLADKDVTCLEKTALSNMVSFQLENAGTSQVVVNAEIISSAGKVIGKRHGITLPVGTLLQEGVLIDLKEQVEMLGSQNIQLKVYDRDFPTTKVYAQKAFSFTAADCPVRRNLRAHFDVGKEDTVKEIKGIRAFFHNPETKQTLSYTVSGAKNSQASFTKDSKGNDIMKVTPKKDFSGVEVFMLKASDGTTSETVEIEINFVKDNNDDDASIKTSTPTQNKLYVKLNGNQVFKLDVSNPDGQALTTKWFVDGKQVVNSGLTYTFSPVKAGTVAIKAELYNQKGKVGERTWSQVIVVDKPVDLNSFSGRATTDLTGKNLQFVSDFTLENAHGKVKFLQSVDLSNVVEFSRIVKIEKGFVAVESNSALDKPAEITLYNTGVTKPIVMVTKDFGNKGTFAECTTCKPVIAANAISFSVSGFSTYKVVQQQPANLQFEKIDFGNVAKDKAVSKTITIKNTGTVAATNVALTSNLNTKYKAKITPTNIANIAPGASASATLEIFIPKDEAAGSHSIGNIEATFSGGALANQKVSGAVLINPESKLEITRVEINGKSSGDLDPADDENEIEVTVKNNDVQDMNDVTITVTIKDVDGDDLEEDVREFDLNDGDDEKKTVKFDLTREKLDDDKYTIEIEVEGEGDKDGATQRTIYTQEVDVEREKHKVVIRRAELSPSIVNQGQQATVDVEIENIGEKDEDDVEIRVTSSALDINLKRSNIDIEKYSDSDNEYETTFTLFTSDAKAGKYTVNIEVFRDGDLEEKVQRTLEVVTGGAVQERQETQRVDTLTDQLKNQLEAQLQAKRNQETNTVSGTTSFRDSDSYLILLAALAGLILVAVLLMFVALGKKKR